MCAGLAYHILYELVIKIGIFEEKNMKTFEVTQPMGWVQPRREIQSIPLRVKILVAVGAILCANQFLGFKSSLNDAIQKERAVAADSAGNYERAIEIYRELHARYPNDSGLTQKLGFAQYHAGKYIEAKETFNLLASVPLTKNEETEIKAVTTDIYKRSLSPTGR